MKSPELYQSMIDLLLMKINAMEKRMVSDDAKEKWSEAIGKARKTVARLEASKASVSPQDAPMNEAAE